MRKAKSCAFLLTLILALALLILPFGALSVSAAESTDKQVTATTSASVKQGNSGYCYVYIDSLESVSTLSVTVHYDADKVTVQSGYVYNSVSSLLNDKSVSDGGVQFSYIFDGKGKAEKTQLFYFRYTVLSDAEVGDTYFDIVVNEAYNSSLQPINVSGSRCAFKVAETVTTKTCSIYSSSSVGASVGEEFEISYRLSTYQIASGSFTVSYDPELFEVVGVTNGAFCDNKIVDINTKLAGSVYVSFVGTEYKSNTNLITVKFKTLKNVAEKSTIKMTVTEFYDLALNPISCSGYTTTANIAFDETYTEDAPSMTLQTAYNAQADKVTLTVKLDRDSMLGAGDFVLKFDTNYLTYNSAEKGFSPTFFNINDKNVSDGLLKFSIISLSNITDEQIVLTVTFDVKHACEDNLVTFEISGSGLTDSLVHPITLNFIDSDFTIPLKHTVGSTIIENYLEPTCTNDGGYEIATICAVCNEEFKKETVVIDKLGHSFGNWYVITAPTCTDTGIEERKCSVCQHTEIKTTNAIGHTESDAVVENMIAPNCTLQGSYDRVIYCSVCNTELLKEKKIIDKLGHNFSDEWIIDIEPTCTELGSQSHHCTRCDARTDVISIPANGHSFGNWYEAKAPTCTETGVNERKCSVCHYTETKTTNSLGHTASAATTENRVEPTCTTNGSYDSVVYCSLCNAELSREAKSINKLGHDHSTEWTVDIKPTCTTEGSKSHHCSRCDNKADVTVIPANGHSFGNWYETKAPTESTEGEKRRDCSACDYYEASVIATLTHDHSRWETIVLDAKLPTCVLSGLTEGAKCSGCGEILIAQNYIPASGHSFGDWYETKAPTCTEAGSEERKCSVCDHIDEGITDALGHMSQDSVIENSVDATCIISGSYDSVVYCSVCDTELSRESIVTTPLGHDYSSEWTIDLKPTCTELGSQSRHCERCDAAVDITEIPASGHNYESTVTYPTCTTYGYTTYVCSVCNYKYTLDTAEALGHTESLTPGKDPTCTTAGYTESVECSVCGEILTARVNIPSKGHDYDSTVIAPSCEDGGYTVYTCACGDTYETDAVDALGHNWLDATEEAPKTCDRCGETEGEKLPAQPTDPEPPIEKNHDECEASGWKRFWNAIGNFFRIIFGGKKKCVCGDKI